MINDVVKNGFQPPADLRPSGEVRRSAPAALQEQAPVEQPKQEAEAPDPAKLQEAVSKLNDYVQNIQRTLSFSVSKETGRTVIEVYDAETKELIRQIPPEETIKLAETLEGQLNSLILRERA